MKIETIISDLEKFLKLEELNKSFVNAKVRFNSDAELAISGSLGLEKFLEKFNTAKELFSWYRQAKNAFDKLPLQRRNFTRNLKRDAIQIGLDAAKTGQIYSGNTSYKCEFSKYSYPYAYTNTEKGSRYSRSCKYNKTDAEHVVKLVMKDIIPLIDMPKLRQISANEGLHLIGLNPKNNSCTWVRCKAKQVVSESGWIAYNNDFIFHSTKSQKDAEAGLAKKIKIHNQEEARKKKNNREYRRLKLMAHICKDIPVTLADAKAMGYCEPGIRNFQEQFNIGDSATFKQLMDTKNHQAIALVLNVARKLLKNKKQNEITK